MAKFLRGSTVWLIGDEQAEFTPIQACTVAADAVFDSDYDRLFHLRVLSRRGEREAEPMTVDHRRAFHTRAAAEKVSALRRQARMVQAADWAEHDNQAHVMTTHVVNPFRVNDRRH